MHHAKIENSLRLQRLLTILRQGGWWTTKELMLATGERCAGFDRRFGAPKQWV